MCAVVGIEPKFKWYFLSIICNKNDPIQVISNCKTINEENSWVETCFSNSNGSKCRVKAALVKHLEIRLTSVKLRGGFVEFIVDIKSTFLVWVWDKHWRIRYTRFRICFCKQLQPFNCEIFGEGWLLSSGCFQKDSYENSSFRFVYLINIYDTMLLSTAILDVWPKLWSLSGIFRNRSSKSHEVVSL